jgi:hypothetical protein
VVLLEQAAGHDDPVTVPPTLPVLSTSTLPARYGVARNQEVTLSISPEACFRLTRVDPNRHLKFQATR